MVGCCLKDNFGEISPWNSRWLDGFLIHQKDVRYIFEGSGIDSLDAFTCRFAQNPSRKHPKCKTWYESLTKKKKLASPWRCVSHIHPVNEDHGWRCSSQPIMENTCTKSTNLPSVSLHFSMVLKPTCPLLVAFFLGSPGSSSSMARWFRRHRHISACLKAPGRHGAEKFLQNHWYSQNVHMGKVIKTKSPTQIEADFFSSQFLSIGTFKMIYIACLDSWVYSPQDSSDQQSYYMFSRGPYWLLLLTVTRRRICPRYIPQTVLNHPESPRCSGCLPNLPTVFVI